MPNYLLAIDQGTSSTRAIVFDESLTACGSHQLPLKQHSPQEGWVEHDPEEIWQSVLDCCQSAIKNSGVGVHAIKAIGITNQRETTLIWDRKTGKTIYPAIVWQDRRTAEWCLNLAADNAKWVAEKTGLRIDSYFSATKICWILDNVPHARARAEKGELAFGTIDTYLLWRLTHGNSYFTDATNASRTLLFDIHTQEWDDELLSLFHIPKSLLPEVRDCCDEFGLTHPSLFGCEIPITAMAGDQQAAMIGHGCVEESTIKSTYGTGCFIVLNTGKTAISSQQGLLTTIAYRINQEVTYALEGSIFSAGSAVKWLHENLHILQSPDECEHYCNQVPDTQGVYFVPAFNGLGAPYWNSSAKAAIFGISSNTHIAHIVRAALESVAYQTKDLMLAMTEDYKKPLHVLQVDGGMSSNNWLMTFLSNQLQLTVSRANCIETTSFGIAFLAGLQVGIYQQIDAIKPLRLAEKIVTPTLSRSECEFYYNGWKNAIARL